MKMKRIMTLLLSLLMLASQGLPTAFAGSIESAPGGGAGPGQISTADGQQPGPVIEPQPVYEQEAPADTVPVLTPLPDEGEAPEEDAEEEPDEEPDENILHIASVEDFRALAASCALDSYSRGLTVILDADLDLSAAPGVTIPIFSGVFEGCGHTISGLMLTGGSNLGLFRYLQEGAVVRDLKLKGTVQPDSGSDKVGALVGSSYGSVENCSFEGSVTARNYVGGLVGESYGSIRDCVSSAEVIGKRFTGGIVGYSEGLILNCENNGAVNTTVTEEMLSLDDLTAVTGDVLELLNAEDENVVSDSGGIAGYSSGVLMNCVNHGAIGYQHFGYNVGGIAGRQAGYLTGCENHGTILGRKDVAGIVGQMEPFLNLISEESLAEEIVTLNEYLNAASGDLAIMAAQMNEMRDDAAADGSSFLDDASNAGTISGGGGTITGADGTVSGGSGGGISGGGGSIMGDDGVSHSNSAADDYNSISDRLSEAYGVISDTSGMLSADLGSANNQFSKVLLMMSDALNGSPNSEVFDDISEQLKQEDTEGRVSLNHNYGGVDGDSNVGGVIGSMGIEYEFDMEDKLVETIGVNGIVNKKYETKCVSSENINYGGVTGRKDRIGGVVGSSETGLVLNCEGYGSVESGDGSYVGGVAGYSNTAIRDSYAMCSIEGNKYVGGITGYGSTITDCATLVSLTSSNVCAGAIAGWADMNVENAVDRNVYVHDKLGAVDGISYAEKAAPVSYEELVAREGVPEEFKFVTVSFVADGELVASFRVPYGGSFPEVMIPEVPEKTGYAGSWQSFSSENLRFNTTVEAEYVLHQGTIAVDVAREDSPMSILLVEGDFQEQIRIELKPYEKELPEELHALEAWELSLDGYTNPDGEGYTVRFLMPKTEKNSVLDLYRLVDGEWLRQELGRSGSYATFHMEDDNVIFAVTTQQSPVQGMLPWIIAAAAALVVIIAVPVTFVKAKKKAAK